MKRPQIKTKDRTIEIKGTNCSVTLFRVDIEGDVIGQHPGGAWTEEFGSGPVRDAFATGAQAAIIHGHHRPSIVITSHQIGEERPVLAWVFSLKIGNEMLWQGIWSSEEQARAALLGLKAGFTFTESGFAELPELPMR